MSTILIASLEPGEGRTAVAAGLAASLAGAKRAVRVLRVRSGDYADAAAEDDARALAALPGCDAPGDAVSEQEAQAQVKDAGVCVVEGPAGVPNDLAARLEARVVLVSARADDERLGDLASAASTLGEALLGVIVTRQQPRRLEGARAALQARGLTCLGVLPEDRQLAGPTVREMAEALHASRLVEGGDEDEAVESVMLAPISADPGQPFFLQEQGHKAVLSRSDKMDLHLAALATEPDCLILTSPRAIHPYLLDRVQGGDSAVTVLHAPEGTVRAVELLDELFGRTRFSGQRKIARAIELIGEHTDSEALAKALG